MKIPFFFVLLFAISCAQPPAKPVKFLINDLSVDFPSADTVILTSKSEFEITSSISGIMVKDSTLFAFEESDQNFGHCYNLTTGKEISTILMLGRASNEMITVSDIHCKIQNDSIQFLNQIEKLIKTFSINDILTKQMSDRKFSTIKLPDSIQSVDFIKTDHSMVGYNKSPGADRNSMKDQYFVFNGSDVAFFGEINNELFDAQAEARVSFKRLSLEFLFSTNGHKIVAANVAGVMLQIIDADKKVIDTERYYNKIIPGNRMGTNGFITYSVRCDNEYIYCHAVTFSKDEVSGENMTNNFIFVFDFELNPIKKYYMGTFQTGAGRYFQSEDGKTFYFMTTNGEKQELFEGKIKGHSRL